MPKESIYTNRDTGFSFHYPVRRSRAWTADFLGPGTILRRTLLGRSPIPALGIAPSVLMAGSSNGGETFRISRNTI